MAVKRVHGTAEVAEALGLRPATVQQYARNGRVPFDTTPGGHRRFDIDEVRAALDARRDPRPRPAGPLALLRRRTLRRVPRLVRRPPVRPLRRALRADRTADR